MRTGGAGNDRPAALPQPQSGNGVAFGSAFEDAINRVDASQKNANAEVEAFVAGEQESLHEVMIAINQAGLTFQLMTEVRNRMVETYQELMRMQV